MMLPPLRPIGSNLGLPTQVQDLLALLPDLLVAFLQSCLSLECTVAPKLDLRLIAKRFRGFHHATRRWCRRLPRSSAGASSAGHTVCHTAQGHARPSPSAAISSGCASAAVVPSSSAVFNQDQHMPESCSPQCKPAAASAAPILNASLASLLPIPSVAQAAAMHDDKPPKQPFSVDPASSCIPCVRGPVSDPELFASQLLGHDIVERLNLCALLHALPKDDSQASAVCHEAASRSPT